jgi:hypothetical protein
VLWTAALLEPTPEQHVVGFSYVVDLEALCVALSSGELLLVHLQTREVEDVGGVEGGIVSVAWSPDGEYVVVVSAGGNLLLMNQVRLALQFLDGTWKWLLTRFMPWSCSTCSVSCHGYQRVVQYGYVHRM